MELSDFQFKYDEFYFLHFHKTSKKLPCNIISHINNKYSVIDLFFCYQKLLPKIMPQNYVHMSSSNNRNMLFNATGCPNCSKSLHRWNFQHVEFKFVIRFAPHHSRQTNFKPLHVAFTCTYGVISYNYRFNRYWVGGQKKRDGYWYWKEPDGDVPMSCPMWVAGMLDFPTYGIGCWPIPKNSKWN